MGPYTRMQRIEELLSKSPRAEQPQFSIRALYFGTSDIPLSTLSKNIVAGIHQISKLRLNALELRFTEKVSISAEEAFAIARAAQEQQVILTCHAPYSIDLSSPMVKVREESKELLFQAAIRAAKCGAYGLVFHAGKYHGSSAAATYYTIKRAVKDIRKRLQEHNCPIWLRPEVTGSPEEWGSLTEVTQISSEIPRVLPCIDYAHLYARSGGKKNSRKDFSAQLDYLKRKLGKNALWNMHITISGYATSDKGRDVHHNIEESEIRYEELVEVWKEHKIKGVVICESPNKEKDALLLKNLWEKEVRGPEQNY